MSRNPNNYGSQLEWEICFLQVLIRDGIWTPEQLAKKEQLLKQKQEELETLKKPKP